MAAEASQLPDPSPAHEDLLEEYFERREQGSAVQRDEVDELLTRAGDERDELERDIEIVKGLDRLASLLAPEQALPEDELQELGRFHDLALIGRGGLSKVYLAHDHLDRAIALKVLDQTALHMISAPDLVIQEAKSLAKLKHPSIVQVFDASEVDGHAYIAMEFIDGPSLYAVLRELREWRADAGAELSICARQLVPLAARYRLVVQLAQALATCHAAGIVHRDIKPGNVLIASDLTPKMIDFGLSHLEETSLGLTQRLVGTAPYIAPEQADLQRTGSDPLSDQFSLGVLLYELLTLQNPFARKSQAATMSAVSAARPPLPRSLNAEIPRDVELICLHAMERTAQRRYPSMDAFAADLQAFLEYRAISLKPPSPVWLTAMWFMRHRAQVVLVAASTLFVLLPFIGTRIWNDRDARARLSARAAGVNLELFSMSESQDFARAYETLGATLSASRALDADMLARWFAAETTPEIEAVVERACQTLAGVLSEKARSLALTFDNDPIARGAQTRILRTSYKPTLMLEASVCGGCDHNRIDRLRGTFEPPPIDDAEERLQLLKQDAISWRFGSALNEVAMSAQPGPGSYRLNRIDASNRILSQLEFSLQEENERLVLNWTPASFRAEETIWIEGALVPTFSETNGDQTAELDPFRITSATVTWRQYAEVMGTDKLKRDLFVQASVWGTTPNVETNLDTPAIVTQEDALRFAAAVGGRLPTVRELYVVLTDVPGIERANGFGGEFTSTPSYIAQSACNVLYEALDTDRGLEWAQPRGTMLVPAAPGTVFRIAFSR